jgi:hypothetical protein
MRFYQIQQLSEQQLDELRMGGRDFKRFLSTPLAKSMRAGFEAEVIFRDALDSSDYDGETEPNMNMDERANDIDDIIEFFSGGDGYMSRGELERLREELSESYMEFDSERMYEEFSSEADDRIRTYLEDEEEKDFIEEWLKDEADLSDSEIEDLFILQKQYRLIFSTKTQREFLDEHPEFQKYLDAAEAFDTSIEPRIQEAIDNQNDLWETVLDIARDEWGGANQRDWLLDNGISWMSDVVDQFDVTWPYYTSSSYGDEGEFNESVAETLADSLSETLGVETTVSGGYHTAKRDETTWIFEPDSSLESDSTEDMPVEIVSPPMPLDQTVEIIPKFFEWLASNNGYTNSSTGFHMSVSMPDHASDNLDFVKLALFLGDEYVLKQFGRQSNTYARSALEKLRLAGTKSPEKIAGYMDKMRAGLDQIAKNSLSTSTGFGKYTSINPKNGYVEFRSAGGSDYQEDLKRLQDTLTRYGMALNVAMDPAAERQEYAKKLYKLLASGVEGEDDAISIFSRYVAKQMPADALKANLKQLQHDREVIRRKGKFNYDDASMPPLEWNGKYQIYNTRSPDNLVYEFNVATDDEALAALAYWRKNIMSPNLDPYNFSVRRNRITATQPRQSSGEITGQWQIISGNTGNQLTTFTGIDNQADADRYAERFMRDAGFRSDVPYSVLPVAR